LEVPILKQGEFLIATIQAALSDADLEQLRLALVQRVVRFVPARSSLTSRPWTSWTLRSRTLREIALMIRLRGAETVIVGIQPEVAFAMVQLGLTLEGVGTALDLEEGLAYLNQKFKTSTEREWQCPPEKFGCPSTQIKTSSLLAKRADHSLPKLVFLPWTAL